LYAIVPGRLKVVHSLMLD